MKVIVAGTIPVNPELREVAVNAVIKCTAETKKEAGCLAYEFSADLVDPNLFHLYELWDEAVSLDAHMKLAHTVELLALMPSFLGGSPNIGRFTVSDGGDLL